MAIKKFIFPILFGLIITLVIFRLLNAIAIVPLIVAPIISIVIFIFTSIMLFYMLSRMRE